MNDDRASIDRFHPPCPRCHALMGRDQNSGDYFCVPCIQHFTAATIDDAMTAVLDNRQTKGDAKREKDLQRLCELELSRREITYLHLSPRAREKEGWPDLVFSVRGRPIAVELKTEDGKLSEDQDRVLQGLARDGWTVAVVRNFARFLEVIE